MRRRRQAPAIPHTVWLLRFCIVITVKEYPNPGFTRVTSTGDKKVAGPNSILSHNLPPSRVSLQTKLRKVSAAAIIAGDPHAESDCTPVEAGR